MFHPPFDAKASGAMLAGYYHRYRPAPAAITNRNTWLAKTLKDNLHHPGSESGAMIQYNAAALERSWATQRRIYAPVWR